MPDNLSSAALLPASGERYTFVRGVGCKVHLTQSLSILVTGQVLP